MFFFCETLQAKANIVEKMLYLHVTTPTQLCYYFGQEMKKRRHGYILNMSSLSCWLPYPGITLYASTKRYLKSFSRGLRSELLDYGVSVTVLCPGAVATNLYNLSDNLKTLAIRLGIMMRRKNWLKKGLMPCFTTGLPYYRALQQNMHTPRNAPPPRPCPLDHANHEISEARSIIRQITCEIFVTSNKNRIFAPLFSPVPCDGKLGSKITNFE